MIRRATFVLLAIATMVAHAASDTYLRQQDFTGGPPRNWGYFHPNQGFGFFPTNANGDGVAGGFFFPKTYTSYYADKNLNGFFNRGTPLSASGTITLDELSFDPNYTNTVYIAHVRQGSTNGTFVNILGISLTGNNQGDILCAPIIQFSDGSAFLGSALKIPVNSIPMNWSYTWDPSGGAQSLGLLTVTMGDATTTLTMGRLSGGIDYTLDSFGLYQPAFVQPNSNSYVTLFIDDLSYTAFNGPAPKLRIKSPQRITASASSITISGTAKVAIGNRIKAVRYRIVRNGKIGRYRNAAGNEKWTATVRVPVGTSRLDIRAVSDSGLATEAHRTVVRTP